jgi:succinoglycan biosynthesis transport protein ExoP
MDRKTFAEQPGAFSQRSRPLLAAGIPNDARATSNSAIFDFRSVFRLLRRRRLFVAAICILCVAITIFVHRITPKEYSASARILLDEQGINPFGREVIFSDLSLSNPAVESQMQVIRSPYLLSRVVDRLNLSENEAFMTPPTTPLREWFAAARSELLPMLDEAPAEVSEARRFQDAVERLRANLSVTRSAQTRVIRIQFSAATPELSAEVVNAVAETYVDNRLGVRQENAERAAQWFDERMAELNVRALEVEQRMAQMSGGGVEALDASQNAASLQRARQNLQDALARRAQTQSEVLRLRALVESGRGLRGVPSNFDSEPLTALAEEAARLQTALAEANRETPQDADEIASLNTRIESIEAAGLSLLNARLTNAQAAADAAEANLEEAQLAFDAARGASGGNVTNAIDVELRTLEGEARIYRELNERYLESYLEVVQQQSFPSTQATVIASAVIPDYPDGPGLRRLAMLALLFGVALGAGSAFALEAADGRIRTASHLSKITQAPVLGVLPTGKARERAALSEPKRLPAISVPHRRIDFSKEVIALPENRVSLTRSVPELHATISAPMSAYSDAIRRVNVQVENLYSILSAEDSMMPKCVGFISDATSDGRSIAAANYAEMLAVGGRKTLLIDMDWTGLYLTECITPAAQHGLAELSLTKSPGSFEQAFWYDERSSMYFLPNRTMDKTATFDPSAFDQMRLKLLIRTLMDKFDTVVLDLSPMANSSDAAAFSDVVMGYIAVVDWGETRSASLSRELRRAAIHPPKLMGTLLNGISQGDLDEYETAV